ncbi:MAG: metal-dependent hydrolase [Candidatus Cloacimonetes bacterium HGW-Cloacimonetes-3]|jgi:hypothetical protein|nr:MAG: metal-dependent hydrolase [Candidatus Cloacimonetes bacterium HGW-Cloacimonetes-3]
MNHITIGKYQICLIHRKMKHIRLTYNAATGRITVSAPIGVSEALIKQFVQPKLPWIEKHVALFEAKGKQQQCEYISGEQHFLEGIAYQLRVIENCSVNRISLAAGDIIELRVMPGSTCKHREILMDTWYRARLAHRTASMIDKWAVSMGVQVSKWGIKKMKSRWGSCNTRKGNIWVSLELAKKSDRLLEYLVVHELVHLLEASHNSIFKALMDGFLPDWRTRKAELNEKQAFA